LVLRKVLFYAISTNALGNILAIAFQGSPLQAQTLTPDQLELPPEIIENSPVLQRWSDAVPDVDHDIRHDPSFKTRWRLGYSYFPDNGDRSGVGLGVEDLFIDPSLPITFSAAGNTTFDGDRADFAARANYYLLPLGSRINIAPTVGYQTFSSENNNREYNREGLEIGAKIQLNLSRSGASNITLSQQFVNLSGEQEMGITTLSTGYAISKQWRIVTEIQKHNSTAAKENRVGLFLEWMP
jgi:hypothetical protein